ncbi:TetR/AcrR family transcriptional regulator [Streptomyces sp. NBC_00878]|uniref:TetR/AcrR family transcriptional regulator n=1 Tax=Streptomyces sp. NBC_00878 TaxID=2975854 RepID=UPI00224F65D4|nr:TetR family transcriptional regulator [Streptomyces sp. NBC_00878]MCX4908980.1 TetR family transcriptional regulator [Streptomyces sp. NBC_00878]
MTGSPAEMTPTESGEDAAPARKRTRQPEVRRAAILEAARDAFAELGFAKTTIRDVARRAGVTHGLVIRHFGSKEQLFLAAVPSSRNLLAEVAGDPNSLPTRVARSYARRMSESGGNDPFVALIRAVASEEEAARRLFAAMQDESLEMYRRVIPGPHLEERVSSVGAYLIGVTFSRYVFKSGPLAEMSDEELVRHLVPNLRAILLG